MTTVTVEILFKQAQQLPIDERRRLARLLLVDTPAPSSLADQLRDARSRIVSSGVPLLTWSEVAAEIANRRGER